MRMRRFAALMVVVMFAAMLAVPATANAATLYVNKGVAKARLGMTDTKAAKKIGKVKKKVVDNDYNGAGLTYYIRYFGKKSHGHYSVVMYANNKHKVIAFAVNSKKYKTKKGVRVGSSVSKLSGVYGSRLKYVNGAYRVKSKHAATYFNVSGGKITSIWIWKR